MQQLLLFAHRWRRVEVRNLGGKADVKYNLLPGLPTNPGKLSDTIQAVKVGLQQDIAPFFGVGGCTWDDQNLRQTVHVYKKCILSNGAQVRSQAYDLGSATDNSWVLVKWEEDGKIGYSVA